MIECGGAVGSAIAVAVVVRAHELSTDENRTQQGYQNHCEVRVATQHCGEGRKENKGCRGVVQK